MTSDSNVNDESSLWMTATQFVRLLDKQEAAEVSDRPEQAISDTRDELKEVADKNGHVTVRHKVGKEILLIALFAIVGGDNFLMLKSTLFEYGRIVNDQLLI